MNHDVIDALISAEVIAQGAGLPFFDPANMAPDRRSTERDGQSRRSGPRVELDAAVRLRGASQGAVDARIFNLSAGGCGLMLKGSPFGAGDLVTIKIEGVEHWQVMVQWCIGRDAGIAFDRPFYPAVFDAIVAIHDNSVAGTAS